MARCFYFLALTGLLMSGVAKADLPSGDITTQAWRLLAVDISTQQDVLDLFGAPREKPDIKTKKLFRYLSPRQVDAMKACIPADADHVVMWKYHNVNGQDGKKFEFHKGHGNYEFTYIAFREDGRVCNVLAHDSDY